MQASIAACAAAWSLRTAKMLGAQDGERDVGLNRFDTSITGQWWPLAYIISGLYRASPRSIGSSHVGVGSTRGTVTAHTSANGGQSLRDLLGPSTEMQRPLVQ
jgi:hypothetical protein